MATHAAAARHDTASASRNPVKPGGVGRVWTVQLVPSVDSAAYWPLTTTHVFVTHETDGKYRYSMGSG